MRKEHWILRGKNVEAFLIYMETAVVIHRDKRYPALPSVKEMKTAAR